jgi:hypothetical protein
VRERRERGERKKEESGEWRERERERGASVRCERAGERERVSERCKDRICNDQTNDKGRRGKERVGKGKRKRRRKREKTLLITKWGECDRRKRATIAGESAA